VQSEPGSTSFRVILPITAPVDSHPHAVPAGAERATA
jgi:nitrogen-specific signal transduction histidine kinase